MQGPEPPAPPARVPFPLTALDRAIIRATQAGLPLVPEPYRAVAAQLGISEDELLHRLHRMQRSGVIRRIAAVPNHYALGFRANGMVVWDVDDAAVERIGTEIGALKCVSHCYQRPRHAPVWRYNLFTMVHGRDRAEVEAHVREIARRMGAYRRAHEILYSRRILKKTGLRLVD